MKKVYLLQNDSLRCNFCGNWFNVPWDFAQQQRFSLNACFTCCDNPHHKFVHPKTYQIIDIKFVKTGISIIDKHQELSNKMDQFAQIYYHRELAPSQLLEDLCSQNSIETQLYHQYVCKINKSKEKAHQIYQELIRNLEAKRDSFINKIQKGLWEFLTKKEEQVKRMYGRVYNYKSNYCPDPETYSTEFDKFKKFIERISEYSDDRQLKNIQSYLREFLSKYFAPPEKCLLKVPSNLHQNKQNHNQNAHKIKSIRSKLTTNTLQKSSSKKSLCSSGARMTRSYASSIRDLKSSIALSDRSSNSRQKSRSKSKQNGLISSVCYGVEGQVVWDSDFDIVREQAYLSMKERVAFESYLPESVSQERQFRNRIYGEKEQMELLVELKQKTVLTQKLFELINCNLAKANISVFLNFLSPHSSIEVLRLVKTNLKDSDFDQLLYWLKDKSEIETLVLTNNRFTQNCIFALIEFKKRHQNLQLKYVYLGNNFIKAYRVKPQLQILQQLGIIVQL